MVGTSTQVKPKFSAVVVTIDPLTQSVKVNGTEVAFTGAIPEFKVGYQYATFFSACTSIANIG